MLIPQALLNPQGGGAGIGVLNRDPGFREVSGKFGVRLGGFFAFWGLLVVTSAFAEVELVYELSNSCRSGAGFAFR